MDGTTGTPSEEALSQLIESLIRFLEKKQFDDRPRGKEDGHHQEKRKQWRVLHCLNGTADCPFCQKVKGTKWRNFGSPSSLFAARS